MKDFVFVSDFDGTLTEKDFYKIISDKYLGEECKKLHQDWKSKRITDVQYLGYVFENIGQNEEGISREIAEIKLDPFAGEFIKNILAANGDFVIVSAGTYYYITEVLAKNNIEGVPIYSNKSEYRDNGIHFILEENSEFYSEIYGIDKEAVVKKLKFQYKKVFYAGDSGPDLKPSLISDVVFARGNLIDMLENQNKSYIKFNNFSEIWDNLKILLKE